MTDQLPFFPLMRKRSRAVRRLLFFCCWAQGVALRMPAAEPVNSQESTAPSPAINAAMDGSNATPLFNVRAFVVEGNPLLPTNAVIPLLARYTGTNVSVEGMAKAASDLQSEYRKEGYPAISVAFVPEHITNGIVTLNVAQTVIPLIMVSGVRCPGPGNGLEAVSKPPVATSVPPPKLPVVSRPIVPATPEEMARSRAALIQKMAELDAQAKDTRVHVVSTNAGPRFEVKQYLVKGATVLPPEVVGQVITNIDGAFGTNVSFDGVATVATELGKAYHERGYGGVDVVVPQQTLTNATLRIAGAGRPAGGHQRHRQPLLQFQQRHARASQPAHEHGSQLARFSTPN